jgi:ribonuclease inhibitor
MNIVVLEGKDLKSKLKVHQLLKDKLELPDYYGENLDALWDCLTGWVSLPLRIVWNDYEYSKNELGSFAEELLQLFLEAKEEIEGFEIEIN